MVSREFTGYPVEAGEIGIGESKAIDHHCIGLAICLYAPTLNEDLVLRTGSEIQRLLFNSLNLFVLHPPTLVPLALRVTPETDLLGHINLADEDHRACGECDRYQEPSSL